MQNKILTTLNQELKVTGLYVLTDPAGTLIPRGTLDGLPIGTNDNSSTGELGLKVIVISERTGANGENNSDLIIPASSAPVITPSDSDVITTSRAIYVGDAGNLAVTMLDGTDTVFTGLAAGSLLPIRVTKVLATGTTCTLINSLS